MVYDYLFCSDLKFTTSYFIMRGEPLSWLFYLAALIPYVGLLMYLNIFLTCKHTLVITRDGLFYEELVSRFGINFIAWEEVVRATALSSSSVSDTGSYINIELRKGTLLDHIKNNPKTCKQLNDNSITFNSHILRNDFDQNGLSPLCIKWRIFLSVLHTDRKAITICADINKAVSNNKNLQFKN